MSYPQQPGSGQPGPPGQGGQPQQQGGWGQPQQPYPQYGPTPTPRYGPPYGPPGPPEPPKKSKTGLFVGLGVAVVLVVVLGITVFATRLAGDGNSADGGSAPAQSQPTTGQSEPGSGQTEPTTGQTEPTNGPPEPLPTAPGSSVDPNARATEALALATKFVGYLNASNNKAALGLGCKDRGTILEGLLLWVEPPTRLTITGPVSGRGFLYVPMSGTIEGLPVEGWIRLTDRQPDPVCIAIFQTKQKR